MNTSWISPRAIRYGISLSTLFALLFFLFVHGCGDGSNYSSTGFSATPTLPITITTVSGTVTATATTTAPATSTTCVNELKGADVYLYDADRLDWVYPVARATTNPDCSYKLEQLINSGFNRNSDGSKAYNDHNPIPSGNYTVIASNNIMVTGGNQLVAVQPQISHFKGDVTGNDLVAYSNNTVPVVEKMLGLARNPDGSFCGGVTGSGSDEAIQITFNMAMARVSVINNIVIKDGLGSQLTGDWTVSADLLSATFYPYPGLTQGMGYTIYVDAAMQNVYGKRLAESSSCSFVASAADTTAPQAVWYSPTATTNIPINTPIQIASSKFLDMGTIHVSSTPSIGDKPVVIYIGNNSIVPGKPYVYEIVPAALLAYGTVYSMSINSASDLAGNPLAPLSTSFTTEATPTPPTVTSTNPVNLATGIALNTEVRAIFSSQMDPLTINAATFTLSVGSANVAGSVSYDSATKTAVFTPNVPLLENTLYTALITTEATNLNGLAMAANKSWSFTTIQNISDVTAPTIPAGLKATAAGTSQLNLSWWAASDNIAVTGYKVYDNAGSLLASVAATSYSLYGLTAGTQYCYRVSAFDAAGNESAKSLLGCAFTSQPTPGLTGSWTATSTVGAPSGRSYHKAVWTGSRMIVWGGVNIARTGTSDFTVNTGGIYNPNADTWTATSTIGAPSIRYCHSTVWTGSKMIVWGGTSYGGNYFYVTNSGGIYDPATDTWTATSTTGAPSARSSFASVWTGTKMIVWGGSDINGNYPNTGGIYDPASNTWSAMSTIGAPIGRVWSTAVWTGTKMIVWGGYSYQNGHIYHNTGGIYDLATNTWTPITTTGAPTGRNTHTAVWTGTKMIVFGGYDGSSGLSTTGITGGIYDPVTNTWSATTTTGAPAVSQHAAAWTGSKMIVWGGQAGAIYDPPTNTWSATETSGAPSGRLMHTAVWTGTQMIVWGGQAGSTLYDTGGVYTP